MQVFLPFKDYKKSAECIDNKRLWKQILEIDGILRIIAGEKTGYKNHPIVKMWFDYPNHLIMYREALIKEWFNRRLFEPPKIYQGNVQSIGFPPFVTDEFCDEYKQILLKKDPVHYSKYF